MGVLRGCLCVAVQSWDLQPFLQVQFVDCILATCRQNGEDRSVHSLCDNLCLQCVLISSRGSSKTKRLVDIVGEADRLGQDPDQDSDEEVAPVQPRAGDARRARPAQPESEDDAEAVEPLAAAADKFAIVTEVRRETSSSRTPTHPLISLFVSAGTG